MNIYKLFSVGFPSYESHPHLGFIDNINRTGVLAPYGHILIIFILSSMVYTLGKSYYIEKYLANELTFGTIISIKQSTNRVNNKPLIDIEIRYEGTLGLFKDQSSDLGFEFDIGDKIPIKYQIDKPEIAIIPSDAISISRDQSSKTQVSQECTNAKFKLFEINPTNESLTYELVGEVIRDNQPVRKASFEHRVDDENIMKFVPGMIIPCCIDGEGDDFEVSIPTN
ncbi:hypothetical protein [Bermanella sp. R86510]|uniref:hypothetical protein n=1 Tax=unclassified Bermanella TaxID=2627862 RepID=UPI0037C672E3